LISRAPAVAGTGFAAAGATALKRSARSLAASVSDAVAWLNRYYMASDATPTECEVADDIKNLVANELIGKAKVAPC
jgi:hypothetical protein